VVQERSRRQGTNVQLLGQLKIPDVMGNYELGPGGDSTLQHHIVVRISQKRTPEKMYVLKMSNRCQVTQKSHRRRWFGACWEMFGTADHILPFGDERHRQYWLHGRGHFYFFLAWATRAAFPPIFEHQRTMKKLTQENDTHAPLEASIDQDRQHALPLLPGPLGDY